MPPTIFGKVQINDRDILTLDVLPDIQLGPMQNRMHADVGVGAEIGLELTPEFRRLILEIPGEISPARREVALLGAGALLVSADADNDRVEVMLRERGLQRVGLQLGAAFHPRQSARGKRLTRVQRRLVASHAQIEVPLAHESIAELNHLRRLETRVDVHERKRHATEERLAHEMQQRTGILADAPEEPEALEMMKRLAQDINALALQGIEMRVAVGGFRYGGHQMFSPRNVWMPHSVLSKPVHRRFRCGGTGSGQPGLRKQGADMTFVPPDSACAGLRLDRSWRSSCMSKTNDLRWYEP